LPFCAKCASTTPPAASAAAAAVPSNQAMMEEEISRFKKAFTSTKGFVFV
jgi:hypothetical protein